MKVKEKRKSKPVHGTQRRLAYAGNLFHYSGIPFMVGLLILAAWSFAFRTGDATLFGRTVMVIGIGVFLIGAVGLLLGLTMGFFEVVISGGEWFIDRLRPTNSDPSPKKKKNHTDTG